MRIFYLTLMVMISLSADLRAQIRHVRGIKSLDASYVSTRFGSGGMVSYVKYFSNTLYGKGSVFMEQGNDAGMNYQSLGGEVTAVKTLFHKGHSLYFNGMGGCVVSMDAVTKGGEAFTLSSQLKLGAHVGIENELYLSDRFVLIVSWSQRFLLSDAFGNYRWFLCPGIRFNL